MPGSSVKKSKAGASAVGTPSPRSSSKAAAGDSGTKRTPSDHVSRSAASAAAASLFPTSTAAVHEATGGLLLKVADAKFVAGAALPRSATVLSLVLMAREDMLAAGLGPQQCVRVAIPAQDAPDEEIGVGFAWPLKAQQSGICQLSGHFFDRCVGARHIIVSPLVSHAPIPVNRVVVNFVEPIAPAAEAADPDLLLPVLAAALVGRVFTASSVCQAPWCGVTVHFTASHSHGSADAVIGAPGLVAVLGAPNTSDETKTKEAHAVDHFAQIGGLQDQIGTIRRIVDMSLRSADTFARYGLKPCRGVLLCGPPGTGKTMLARAVAASAGVKVIVINGSSILSRYVGESEAMLRGIFETAAAAAPALIFIDELDGLCPARSHTSTEVETRLVATLLSLMDGLESQSQVVLLGATNRPNAIDPALRRPGRFDREIEVGIPTLAGRLDILRTLLGGVPSSVSEEELADIAELTNGYVGADLKALVHEALLQELRAVTDGWNADVDKPVVSLTGRRLREATKIVGPSALRSVRVDVPHVKWSDIGGQECVKQQLREAVEWPLLHPEAFIHMGIRPPKGVLLYGPPGCSKTMMAKAMATESRMNFIAVKGPELFSLWVGESEKAVAEVFRKARAAAPTVIFFDEMDALAVHRTNADGASSVGARVLSQLLQEMDGISELKQVVVVGATNRPDLLDKALLRPGRFDRLVYVGPPDLEGATAIINLQLKRVPHTDDIDVGALAPRVLGLSGAEIVSVFQSSAMLALQEDITATRIASRHIDAAIAKISPQITPLMLQFYAKFQLTK